MRSEAYMVSLFLGSRDKFHYIWRKSWGACIQLPKIKRGTGIYEGWWSLGDNKVGKSIGS